MGWYDNPYDKPEDYGLTLIGEALDLNEPNYSFDLLAVWKDDAGFYLGTDSGCSCPSPFENYEGRGDMTGPLTAEQAIEEARNLAAKEQWNWEEERDVTSVYDQAGLDKLVAAIGAAA